MGALNNDTLRSLGTKHQLNISFCAVTLLQWCKSIHLNITIANENRCNNTPLMMHNIRGGCRQRCCRHDIFNLNSLVKKIHKFGQLTLARRMCCLGMSYTIITWTDLSWLAIVRLQTDKPNLKICFFLKQSPTLAYDMKKANEWVSIFLACVRSCYMLLNMLHSGCEELSINNQMQLIELVSFFIIVCYFQNG